MTMKKPNHFKAKCAAFASMALLLSGICWAEGDEFPLSGDFDFLAIKDLQIKTSMSANADSLSDWTGEGYHAGIQLCGFTLYNCSDINKDVTLPDSAKFTFAIADSYGNSVDSVDLDMTSAFKKLKFTNKFSQSIQTQVGVYCGGRYKASAKLSPDFFSYETEIDLIDEACTRVSNNSVKVGGVLCPIIYITSGYPYDVEAVAGEHSLQWSVTPDDNPNKILANDTETFNLSNDKPLLAATDTLDLPVPELEPGKYIYTISSDFAGANRTFEATVIDTLKTELSLDKELYTVGVDKEAKLKIDMSYGYPYIATDSDTGTSTLRVVTTLLDDSNSVEYSDKSWATSTVQCTADIAVPLDKVTSDVVKQYEGKVPLNLSVVFNSETQYQATVLLNIEAESTGVRNITIGNDANQQIQYYNVFGMPVDDSYHGIVISNDGRKLLK